MNDTDKMTNEFNVIYPSLSAVDEWNTRGRYAQSKQAMTLHYITVNITT